MRASELHRSTPSRIVGTAIALGVLVAILAGVESYHRTNDGGASGSDQVSSTQIAQAGHMFEAKQEQLDAIQAVFGRSARMAGFALRFDTKQAQLDAALDRMSENAAPTVAERFIESKLDRLDNGQ